MESKLISKTSINFKVPSGLGSKKKIKEKTEYKNENKDIKCLVTVFCMNPDRIKIKKQSIASD
jgi:hypothetical protein